jgi:hypothetical protein
LPIMSFSLSALERILVQRPGKYKLRPNVR